MSETKHTPRPWKLENERNALRTENTALIAELRALVAGIERAAAAGIDLSGYVGTGRALALIARVEGRR